MMVSMAAIPEGSLLGSLQGYVSAGAVGCSPDRITAASRFQDGNRHAVYKVSYVSPAGTTEDLVVRVSLSGAPADCAQAEREATVLKKAGGIAAPLLYDFRCNSRWFETPTMCMEFVPGQQKELRSAALGEIERLGSVVAWVHELPVDDLVDGSSEPGDLVSYAEGRLQSIMSTLVWARDPLPAAIQSRLRIAANSVQRSWGKARRAGASTLARLSLSSTVIPAPGTYFGARAPILIDWEYARLGDPADEIAYLLDQNDLSQDNARRFGVGTEGASALKSH